MKNAIFTTLYAKRYTLYAILVFLLCLILPQTTQAADYYLDAVNGDDANPGTSSQPWKTLNRAYTWYSGTGLKVQEGDTVYFRDGNYGTFQENDQVSRSQHVHRTNWITYKAAPGHTPELNNIDIHNIYLDIGQSYLIFDGFHILDGATFIWTEYIEISDCNFTAPTAKINGEEVTGYYGPYFPGETYNLYVEYASHVKVENSTFSRASGGMKVYGDYITIRNNIIHYLANDGITMATGGHYLLENNTVYDIRRFIGRVQIWGGTKTGDFIEGELLTVAGTSGTGRFIRHFTGGTEDVEEYYELDQSTIYEYWHGHRTGFVITGQTSGATVTDPRVIDPFHTDCLGWSGGSGTIPDVVIRNNIFDNYTVYGRGGSSGQGIKLDIRTGTPALELTFENNLVLSGQGGPMGGWANAKLNNNTIFGSFEFRTDRSSTTIAEMYNNIFHRLLFVNDGKGYTISVGNHGNNIIYNLEDGFTSPPTMTLNTTELNLNGNITSYNNLFVDAANGDFHLKSGSAAINFGDPAHAPSIDIEGNTRDAKPDAGCYEYGALPLEGDLNKDGKVNIQDVQCCFNHIQGTQDWGKAADANRDGKIDDLDMQEIINIILGK